MVKTAHKNLITITVVCLSVLLTISVLIVVSKENFSEKETKNSDKETKNSDKGITPPIVPPVVIYDEDSLYDGGNYSRAYLRTAQRALDTVMGEFSIVYTVVDLNTNRLKVGLSNREMENAIIEFLNTKFDGFEDGCIVFEDTSPPTLTATNIVNFGTLQG
ncbi:MAG: hypothetical protein LBH79_04405 [Nitrososphaerota archaeon]|jgi:hypothetical protein|nr:hypothetical protein [Nitrososphaerota archaeon]